MNLDMQDAHFESQTLAQQTAIYETIEEIAAASSAGTTVGHVRKAMDEMKIAQIFPSNLNYDVLGITKTLMISSNNCEADVFYPTDDVGKPAAVDPFAGWKQEGHGLGPDGKPINQKKEAK